MSSPKGHVKFDTFKEQIATRYDRADPLWSMTISYDTEEQNPEHSSKTISFNKVL